MGINEEDKTDARTPTPQGAREEDEKLRPCSRCGELEHDLQDDLCDVCHGDMYGVKKTARQMHKEDYPEDFRARQFDGGV